MEIKVGDLVSAYWKGYYEVVKITKRWENKEGTTPFFRTGYCIIGEENFNTKTCGKEMNPLITCIQKFTEEGKPVVTKKEKVCDSLFCKIAEEKIQEDINKLEIILKLIKNVH